MGASNRKNCGIYDNMKVGAPFTSYATVRESLESNYKCLGISCADVGALWDDENSDYIAGPPCIDEVPNTWASCEDLVSVYQDKQCCTTPWRDILADSSS